MGAIKLLHTRYSASKLGEPAPTPDEGRTLLESVDRVPDDLLVGFMHVRTDTRAPKTRPPRSPDEFVRHSIGTVVT